MGENTVVGVPLPVMAIGWVQFGVIGGPDALLAKFKQAPKQSQEIILASMVQLSELSAEMAKLMHDNLSLIETLS